MSSPSISPSNPTKPLFLTQEEGVSSTEQQISMVQVPPTEAQLTARSKLRELKVQAEQRLISARSEEPQFIVVQTPHPDPIYADSFSHYAARQAKRAEEINQGAAYLNRLINVAYPTKDDGSAYTQKVSEIKNKFQTYLGNKKESEEEGAPPKKINEISSRVLNDTLRDLHVARLEEELRVARENQEPWTLTPQERSLFSNQLYSTKDRPLPERYEFSDSSGLKNFFEKQKISLLTLQTGAFAKVYKVSSKDGIFPNNKYVLKEIKKTVDQDPQIDFWRQQEFAPARLNGVPNIVRTLFFMVSVTAPNQGTKHYLLPADELKIFGLYLAAGSKVRLEGQLMERAPGMSLYYLTTSRDSRLSVEDVKKIAQGLFETLSALHAHNLVHGDFNLGNIFYDPISGKVTLLDFGFAQRFRKREKEGDSGFHKNPLQGNTTSKIETLKTNFRAPHAVDKKLHGSEVDFFSYAVVLLNILSPEDANTAAYRKPIEQRFLFSGKDPLENYLELTQEWDGHNNAYLPSRTKEILETNPDLKAIIKLAFRISKGGEDGAKTLEELSKLYEKGYDSQIT